MKKVISMLTSKADLTNENETLINLPTEYAPDWTPLTQYKKGQVVGYKDIKYLLMTNATAQAHQPPDMPNGAMLSVYKPYQGKYNYLWVYGEYSEIGYTRLYDNKLYEAIQNPNANIYPPNQVPSIWKEIQQL